MLDVNSIPTGLNNSCQNPPMILLSLSLTMVFGSPCNHNISLKNNSTTFDSENWECMSNKWEIFLGLSTIK